jgi:hypothetical protein
MRMWEVSSCLRELLLENRGHKYLRIYLNCRCGCCCLHVIHVYTLQYHWIAFLCLYPLGIVSLFQYWLCVFLTLFTFRSFISLWVLKTFPVVALVCCYTALIIYICLICLWSVLCSYTIFQPTFIFVLVKLYNYFSCLNVSPTIADLVTHWDGFS